MKILSIVNFVAAFQGVFLSYVLVNTRWQLKEYRVLALLVFILSISILGPVLGTSGYYKVFPHLTRIGDPLVFLIGPLIFIYITILTTGKLPAKLWLHFLPFLIYTFSNLPFYLLDANEKIEFLEQVFLSNKPQPLVIFIQVVRMIHLMSYVIICIVKINKYDQLIRSAFSNIDRINLDKCRYILKLFIFVSVFGILIQLTGFFYPMNFVIINSLIGFVISLIIYSLAYATWKHASPVDIEKLLIAANDITKESNGLVSESAQESVSTTDTVNRVEEAKSRLVYKLSEMQFGNLSDQIDKIFSSGKVYLQNDYSLAQLGKDLGIPAYQASELINRKYGATFYDVINQQRIDEVKRRLSDPKFEHLSILGIAMDCGFNSKSSFNSAFRKFTGKTPSEYKKDIS
ncbi:MAG: AraC family transcriptional regulator [Bacteroidetes bacterium]|nr:AraC family transcriptional regulator [Bacteroidota bacterium]